MQVVNLSINTEEVNNWGLHKCGLHGLMSKLDLSKDGEGTRRPNYDELYPENWAGNREKEEIHKSAFLKMIQWPVDDKNMVRCLFL